MSLREKLLDVAKELSYVTKSGENKNQNYRYVEEAEVKKMVREALYERGVITTFSVASCNVTPSTTAKGSPTFLTQVMAQISFVDVESGDKVDVYVPGQGIDQGDKGVYKAMTGAIKYALLNNFMIPSGEDPEAYADHDEYGTEAKDFGYTRVEKSYIHPAVDAKVLTWKDIKDMKVEQVAGNEGAIAVFTARLSDIDPKLDLDKLMQAIGGRISEKFPGATLGEVYTAAKGLWEQYVINLAEKANRKLDADVENKKALRNRHAAVKLVTNDVSQESE